jgi:hypothetical protein
MRVSLSAQTSYTYHSEQETEELFTSNGFDDRLFLLVIQQHHAFKWPRQARRVLKRLDKICSYAIPELDFSY